MRVLEFFSGIGGMREALAEAWQATEKESGEELEFEAVDTAALVKQVYEWNEGRLKGKATDQVRRANIETLKLSFLDGRAQIWTMSPPCQPFTTTARSKQLGIKDPRNKGFMHLMEALKRMENKPEWIFLENVKGFVDSDPHKLWLDTLHSCGYSYNQYLLSPIQFRIPNSRVRFYMACHLDDRRHRGEIVSSVRPCSCTAIKTFELPSRTLDVSFNCTLTAPLQKLHTLGTEDGSSGPEGTNCVREFLQSDEDNASKEAIEEVLIPDEVLTKKWASGLSYVGVEDRCTFCFTSSYGATYHKSSGSLLHLTCANGRQVEREENMAVRHSGKVRMFTPKELLNLFAFPKDFSFPPDTTLLQRYKVVGQSVNVVVVRGMMHSELCREAQKNEFPIPRDLTREGDTTAEPAPKKQRTAEL